MYEMEGGVTFNILISLLNIDWDLARFFFVMHLIATVHWWLYKTGLCIVSEGMSQDGSNIAEFCHMIKSYEHRSSYPCTHSAGAFRMQIQSNYWLIILIICFSLAG